MDIDSDWHETGLVWAEAQALRARLSGPRLAAAVEAACTPRDRLVALLADSRSAPVTPYAEDVIYAILPLGGIPAEDRAYIGQTDNQARADSSIPLQCITFAHGTAG